MCWNKSLYKALIKGRFSAGDLFSHFQRPDRTHSLSVAGLLTTPATRENQHFAVGLQKCNTRGMRLCCSLNLSLSRFQ